MKALVQFTGLDSNLRENVTSHIRKNWSEVTISGVASNIPPSEGHSPPALLIIGSNTALFVNSKVPLIEFIEVDSTFSMEQVLFWVDAKLGRLTKSDMVYTKSKVSRKSAISRRQFLLGIAGRIPHADDAPVVLENSCEAKFGCSKCVDACPAPGSLRIEKESVIVSSEHCIRCGLCAGVCPVAAIQMPKFPEDAYRGLIAAVDSFPAPQKTLVITCDERGFTPEPWMDVEIVPGVGFAGVRQLALAADSSIGAVIVHCHDGLCPGKENAKQAVKLISSLTGENGPVLAYIEGEARPQIAEIHKRAQKRDRTFYSTGSPWKDYVKLIKSTPIAKVQASGLGLTSIEVAESCTLCNACAERCPHQALAIQQDELLFKAEECTGCGYCAQICPEDSITLSAMNGPLNLQTKAVYKDEMIKCAKCGAPFVSAKMLKKISETLDSDHTLGLCPSCKQSEIYEKIYGASHQASAS